MKSARFSANISMSIPTSSANSFCMISPNAQKHAHDRGRHQMTLLESLATTEFTYSSCNRRQLLTGALALGSTESASEAASANQSQSSTFTLAANWAPTDIDPHSGYDPGSGFVLAGIYENLIRQRPGPDVQLEPWLAESWETSNKTGAWAFHLRPGVTFHDGSLLTAQAAQDSFVREMTCNAPPPMCWDASSAQPDQIVAIDDLTLRFDLGRPQPIFGIAMAAPYGASIMNVAAVMQYEVDGDLGLAWSQMNPEGLGTGPIQKPIRVKSWRDTIGFCAPFSDTPGVVLTVCQVDWMIPARSKHSDRPI